MRLEPAYVGRAYIGEETAMVKELGKSERYHIYIGMNDKEKLKQLCPTDEFIKIVSSICKDYRIAFSMATQTGGYMMANGTFVVENSLVLSIAGLNQNEIGQLAEELKERLNQESILITRDTPEVFIVTD